MNEKVADVQEFLETLKKQVSAGTPVHLGQLDDLSTRVGKFATPTAVETATSST